MRNRIANSILSFFSFFSFLALALISSCVPQQEPPLPSAGQANFSRVVVLGGHILSGYRDGALSESNQQSSVGHLIGIAASDLGNVPSYPALSAEGGLGINVKPWESSWQTGSQLASRVDCEGTESMGPVKDTLGNAQASPQLPPSNAGPWSNLAFPFCSLADIDRAQPNLPWLPATENPFFNRFAPAPGNASILVEAQAQAPTFVVMWPGMQDIYNWASFGGHYGNLPDFATFYNDLDGILASLTANGAQGVLATVPDIRHIPFFTTIPSRGLELSQGRADSLNDIYDNFGTPVNFVAGTNGFLAADPFWGPNDYRQMLVGEYLCLTTPLDSIRCHLLGVLFKLMPDQYSLLEGEMAMLDAATDMMNQIIRDRAEHYGFAVAETAALYEDLQDGLVVDGIAFDATFVSGGFFSLDGYTPTGKGAGIIANEFIHAINLKYEASLPTVRIDNLEGVRFP